VPGVLSFRVPVIGGFAFLSEEDKIKIFHKNPARVVPALAKINR
jgi:hypothetical protein